MQLKVKEECSALQKLLLKQSTDPPNSITCGCTEPPRKRLAKSTRFLDASDKLQTLGLTKSMTGLHGITRLYKSLNSRLNCK